MNGERREAKKTSKNLILPAKSYLVIAGEDWINPTSLGLYRRINKP